MPKKKLPLVLFLSLSVLILTPVASAEGINFGNIGYRYHTTPNGTHVYWAFENMGTTVDRMGLVNEGWTLINNDGWESNIRVVPEGSPVYVSVDNVRPVAGGGVNAFKGEISDSVEQEVTIIISGLKSSSEYNVYEDGSNIGSDVTTGGGLFEFKISDVSSTYEIRKVKSVDDAISTPSLGSDDIEPSLEIESTTGIYKDGVFKGLGSFKRGEKATLRVRTTRDDSPVEVDAVSVSLNLEDGIEKSLESISRGVYETEFLIPDGANIGSYVAEVKVRDGFDITEKNVVFNVVKRRGLVYTIMENLKWVIAILLIVTSYLVLFFYED